MGGDNAFFCDRVTTLRWSPLLRDRMLLPAMRRLLPLLLVFVFAPGAPAQDFSGGIDLLYPEFAHPREDAFAAIQKRDYRFISVDRHGKDVPGLGRYPRMVETYGIQIVKQRFRIFASPSQNFSFILRARAYAEEYNRTLLHYLLTSSRRSDAIRKN
jgi:hypothetical protein